MIERGELIACLSLAKWDRDQAAVLAGVSRATLYRAMRFWGVAAPRANRKLDRAAVAEIRQLYGLGVSGTTLALSHGVHPNTVYRAAHTRTYKVNP